MKDNVINFIKNTVRKTFNSLTITVKLPFVNFSFAPLILIPQG